MNCDKCKKKGRVEQTGKGWVCELPAKDRGKVCVYNDECQKSCKYQSAEQEKGVCEAFSYGSNVFSKECNHARGEEILCPDTRKGVINFGN